MSEGIDIKSRDWRVIIQPDRGCGISLCQYKGFDIFRPAPDGWTRSDESGYFPLVPVSNRIENSRFKFNGQTYTVKNNNPLQPHAIHGIGWERAWKSSPEENAPSSITCHLEHVGDETWPWDIECTHSFRVEDKTLIMVLSVRNMSPTPMPAMLGFHPYFPDKHKSALRFKADGLWLTTPERLPTEHITVPRDNDFKMGRNLSRYASDNVFTGVKEPVYIEHEGQPFAYKMTSYLTKGDKVPSSMENLIVYVPEDEDFFCVEPVSHLNNAFNLLDDDVVALAPGETYTATLCLEITEP